MMANNKKYAQSPSLFEFAKVFHADAEELLSARGRLKMLHGSKDLRAAGNEVEIATRRILAKRLPSGCYVGHGHIVDHLWNCSGQLDVILADKFSNPVLFQSEDDTEYFPFESVYAIGEVKSSFDRSGDDIEKFASTLKVIKGKLSREKTPTDFITTGRGRGFSIKEGYKSLDPRPYKNPLFSFMLFVSSNGMKPDDIIKIYEKYPIDVLPSLLCFLDVGVLGFGKYSSENGFLGIHEMPDFASAYEEPGMVSHWTWWYNQEKGNASTTSLAWLLISLSSHIRNCMLMPPDLMQYGRGVLDLGKPYWKPLLPNQTLD